MQSVQNSVEFECFSGFVKKHGAVLCKFFIEVRRQAGKNKSQIVWLLRELAFSIQWYESCAKVLTGDLNV